MAQQDEFPIVCETCLGTNPHIKMTREPFGKECKICNRPFTIFRWKPQMPGMESRYKKTEICQQCAKEKNVCQTCLLDLQHGLPIQVRDALLAQGQETAASVETAALSQVNLDYHFALKRLRGEEPQPQTSDTVSDAVKQSIAKLSHDKPYFKRNRPHVCSFWVKGECKRGDECPYLHEAPKTGPLAHQNIKDRYHGTNDPVAQKMLERLEAQKKKTKQMSGALKKPTTGSLRAGRRDYD
ncbi:putative Pre-mRNA-splicing factor RBM22 [Blattamonas nauphoetae]|uniref:Pre-mRNA-splicing factor RBM22 n=1 Tax=Blattamonas nauphoetae TaxID=2049346 RepID=A0ABQ9YCT7_9EUKA|nr:putative Pre-mRNA-splicing factor RBM22 [Blattamonas nauphoetae]